MAWSFHSHLTDAERAADWRRVASGQVTSWSMRRSAVFAPTRKLGLIVIDEEHETSFKQESTPRYHGRDVAVMRARLENIPILMGSATPSVGELLQRRSVKRPTRSLKLPTRVEDPPAVAPGDICSTCDTNRRRRASASPSARRSNKE